MLAAVYGSVQPATGGVQSDSGLSPLKKSTSSAWPVPSMVPEAISWRTSFGVMMQGSSPGVPSTSTARVQSVLGSSLPRSWASRAAL